MSRRQDVFEVTVEVGKSRTFAYVPAWPGWSRSGRDEDAALRALYDYAPRYARVLQAVALDFPVPLSPDALDVVGRVPGNATTDFGAPNVSLPNDADVVEPAERERYRNLLHACWLAFDSAVAAAEDKTLRKGPRGGGRDLARIVEHVCDVDHGYLTNLGGKLKRNREMPPEVALVEIRDAILTTLDAAVRGELPTHGPRGGLRWTPRYFVRRLAWHELDHTWEIEDRAE